MLSILTRLRWRRAWNTGSIQNAALCLLEERFRRSPRSRQVHARRNAQQKEERSERQNEPGDAIAAQIALVRRYDSRFLAVVRGERSPGLTVAAVLILCAPHKKSSRGEGVGVKKNRYGEESSRAILWANSMRRTGG